MSIHTISSDKKHLTKSDILMGAALMGNKSQDEAMKRVAFILNVLQRGAKEERIGNTIFVSVDIDPKSDKKGKMVNTYIVNLEPFKRLIDNIVTLAKRYRDRGYVNLYFTVFDEKLGGKLKYLQAALRKEGIPMRAIKRTNKHTKQVLHDVIIGTGYKFAGADE